MSPECSLLPGFLALTWCLDAAASTQISNLLLQFFAFGISTLLLSLFSCLVDVRQLQSWLGQKTNNKLESVLKAFCYDRFAVFAALKDNDPQHMVK